MNIIKEFYYGDATPGPTFYEPGSDYAGLAQIAAENERILANNLSNENTHLFNQLVNAHKELYQGAQEERFADGFRFGARFMLDTFFVPSEEFSI